MDLTGCEVSHESRFLSEDLILQNTGKGTRQVFVFDRSKAALVGHLTDAILARTPLPAAVPAGDIAPEPTPA